MADKYGILKIVDNYFDKLKGTETTSNEYYSTIYSYLTASYNFIEEWLSSSKKEELKDKRDAFYNSAKDVVEKIRGIELLKTQKYVIPYTYINGDPDKLIGNLTDYIISLKNKYINRNFYNQLREENQKDGYNETAPYEETIYVGRELKPSLQENGTVSVNYYTSYENETAIVSDQIYYISTDNDKDDKFYEQLVVKPEYFDENSGIFNDENYGYKPLIDVIIQNIGTINVENNIKFQDNKSHTTKTARTATVAPGETKMFHILPSSVSNYMNTDDGKDENSTSIFDKCFFCYSNRSVNDGLDVDGIVLGLKTGTYKITVNYRYLVAHNIAYFKVSKNNADGKLYNVYIKGRLLENVSQNTDTGFSKAVLNYGTNYSEGILDVETSNVDGSNFDIRLLLNESKGTNAKCNWTTDVIFSDGFLVDYLNNYENNISVFLELFEAIYNSLEEDNETNYLEDYLKKYFYDGILERYRTNKIEDKNTTVSSIDTNFERNKFPVLSVYETLKGKGRNINGLGTLDFGYYRKNGQNKYVNYTLDKILIYQNGKIKLYIKSSNLDSYLRTIATNYADYSSSNGNSFINAISNRYNRFRKRKNIYYTGSQDEDGKDIVDSDLKNNTFFQTIALNIKSNADELKNNILKQYFFTIRINFTNINNVFIKCDENGIENKNYNSDKAKFFASIREQLEEEYFYNSYKNCNIDFNFENYGKYFVIIVDTGISNTVFSDGYNLGSGVLYTRRIIQKLKDNLVSKSKSDFNISRDSLMEPIEFYSVMDDRETSVVITSNAITDTDGSDSIWDEKNQKLVKINFPEYKYSILKKQEDGTYLLDVTDFQKYNDVEAIQQIRIVNFTNNSEKFLFNIEGTSSEYINDTTYNLRLDFLSTEEAADKYKFSYIKDQTIYLSSNIVNSVGKDTVSLKAESETEKLSYLDDNIDIALNETIDEDYINNGKLYLSNASIKEYDKEKHYNYLNRNEIDSSIFFKTKKYLILKENINSPKMSVDAEMQVKIIDYIISNGNSKFLELPKLNYDSRNNTTQYEYYKAFDLKLSSKNFNIKIGLVKPEVILNQARKITKIPKKIIIPIVYQNTVNKFSSIFKLQLKFHALKNLSKAFKIKKVFSNSFRLIKSNYFAPRISDILYGYNINIITNFYSSFTSSSKYGLKKHLVYDKNIINNTELYNIGINTELTTLWQTSNSIAITGRNNIFRNLYSDSNSFQDNLPIYIIAEEEIIKNFPVNGTSYTLSKSAEAYNIKYYNHDYKYSYNKVDNNLEPHDQGNQKEENSNTATAKVTIVKPTIELLK